MVPVQFPVPMPAPFEGQCGYTTMARSHCQTQIRTLTPYAAIGDKDPSLDLCNVNFQQITLVAKGKTLRIRV